MGFALLFAENRQLKIMPASRDLLERESGFIPPQLPDDAYRLDRITSPVVGEKNALVILVQYPDRPADTLDHNPDAYRTLLFDTTGAVPTGSMTEYYLENSRGQFRLKGVVTVWLTLPETNNFYTGNNYGFNPWPNSAQKLAQDAVIAADPLVDYSQFDEDGDGFVDALFIVHAGPGAEETGNGNDIWSHKWFIPGPNGQGYGFMTNDGVYCGSYAMEPEMHSNGNLISIGVFCHEYGHVLGLPDLYDTDYSSEGIGYWGLMGGGSWGVAGNVNTASRPTHFSAWSKYKLGWVTPQLLTQNRPGELLPPVQTSGIIYRLWTAGQVGQEYFLVERRAQVGFDSGLPDDGLLIWHIDESQNTNSNDDHRLVDLEEADGLDDLDHGRNRGDGGDMFPGSTGKENFNEFTYPNSLDYSGSITQVAVENIARIGTDIYADLNVLFDSPYLVLDSLQILDANGNQRVEAGESFDLIFYISNRRVSGLNFDLQVESLDPAVVVQTPQLSIGMIPGGGNWSNGTTPISATVQPGVDPHWSQLQISITQQGDTLLDEPISFLIGFPNLLIVDDDPAGDNEEAYHTVLSEAGILFDQISAQGAPSALFAYSQRDVIFWDGGRATTFPVLGQMLDSLQAFLQAGGALVIAGDHIAEYFQGNAAFTNLTGQSFAGHTGEIYLFGEDIHPLSQGKRIALKNGGNPAFFSDTTGMIFHYFQSHQPGVAIFGGGRGLLLGFSIAGILDRNNFVKKSEFILGILDYFQTPLTGLAATAATAEPRDWQLFPAYPNPFNATVHFAFQIPGSQHQKVTVQVSDLLGRRVRTLWEGALPAGIHRFSWDGTTGDGSPVSSGVYILTVSAPRGLLSQKVWLIR